MTILRKMYSTILYFNKEEMGNNHNKQYFLLKKYILYIQKNIYISKAKEIKSEYTIASKQ